MIPFVSQWIKIMNVVPSGCIALIIALSLFMLSAISQIIWHLNWIFRISDKLKKRG